MNTIPQEDTQDTASTEFHMFSFGKKNKTSRAKNLKEKIVRKLTKEALITRGVGVKMSRYAVDDISYCKNNLTPENRQN